MKWPSGEGVFEPAGVSVNGSVTPAGWKKREQSIVGVGLVPKHPDLNILFQQCVCD